MSEERDLKSLLSSARAQELAPPARPTRPGRAKGDVATPNESVAPPSPEQVRRLASSSGRVEIAPGLTLGADAKSRKRAREAAREHRRAVMKERTSAARDEARAKREERRATTYLPPSGERRPDALRIYRPARATSTNVTADVAAMAYPFLAEAGLGSDGLLIGNDAWSGAPFVFDPWVLYEKQVVTNPNMLIAGVIGKGKALALDTELPTPDGVTTMGAVAVGDQLLDEEGKPTTVVAATDVLEGRPCYELTFEGGVRVIADAEHEWAATVFANGEPTGQLTRWTTLSIAAACGARGWSGTIVGVDLKRPGQERWHRVVAARPVTSVPVRCVQVDSPNSLYLCTKAGIPTHNSTLAKSLVTRAITVGRKAYVACDPKGEWTPVAHAVGGQVIRLGSGKSTRLNPLDAAPRPRGVKAEDWAEEVRRRRSGLLRALIEASLARALGPVESTAIDVAVDHVVATNGVPLLGHVVEALLQPTVVPSGSTLAEIRDAGRDAGHALRRLVEGDLRGLFDGPSTETFDPSLPMVSIDMSAVSGSQTLIAMVSTCSAAWMESALADPEGGKRYLVYDEAWRMLASPALLARMQQTAKLSRSLGVSQVLVIHRLSDLDAVGDEKSEARNLALGLLADCSIKVIYAQERGENEATGRRLGLTDTEIEELPGLGRGVGLWRVGEHSFLVNHRVTRGELELFDTNQRMVDE